MSAIQQVILQPDDSNLARIRVLGLDVSIPYTTLRDHWSYATPDDLDYLACSTFGPYLVVVASVSEGQGGVLALWHAEARDWIQIVEAAHAVTAMVFPDAGRVLSLHDISFWGYEGPESVLESHELKEGCFRPFDYEGKRIDVTWARENFHPGQHDIERSTLGTGDPNDPGFGGLYLARTSPPSVYAQARAGVAKLSLQDLL